MGDTAASAISYKITTATKKVPYRFLQARRGFSRAFLNAFYSLLTDMKIEGLEHIPNEGPLLVLPNHLSNLDGPLVLGMYPHALEMVGPGDFKMEPFKTMMMSVYGMTLIRRGYADSTAVSKIIRHLRNKKHLLMFPSGGMWEKRSFSNKIGAAYFSQLTQTPILPVGISGAYLQSHRTLSMHKPKLVLRFGEVIEPVSKKGSKSEREDKLKTANQNIEKVMYNLLEESEQQRYERWERELYGMEVRFKTKDEVKLIHHYSEGVFPALAEFAIKPNLFRPMWRHAKKDMSAFLTGKVYSVEKIKSTVQDLYENLSHDFSQYLHYRMGDDFHNRVMKDIAGLNKLCTNALTEDAEMQLVPTAYDPFTRTTRTTPHT